MTLDLLLAAITLLYLVQILFFLHGISRPRDTRENQEQFFASVIVAARNEADNIRNCLESLLQQTYPRGNYEILVVDDHSTDGTGVVCRSYTDSRIRVLSPPADGPLRGKTNALAHGIDHARGTIILITDADCVVPPTWIEETVRRYVPGVGITGGMTLQRAESAFGGIQSLDWGFLLGIAAAGVSLRNPLSTIGNNLSFRRAAYEDIGGYRRLKFSVTEDYALFQAIVRTKRWEYLYPIDPSLLVVSEPCSSMRDLLRQKQRWGKGGLDMKFSGFLIMTIGFLQHAALLLAILFGSFVSAAIAFLVKAIADYFFLHHILSRLRQTNQLRFFFWFELYYFIYVLLLPFLVFFGGRVHWKGRSF